jgi:hypothetical protein
MFMLVFVFRVRVVEEEDAWWKRGRWRSLN